MTCRLESKLRKREQLGNLRRLQMTPLLIDFSSNDYLGLARSPLLEQAVKQEWHTPQALNGYGSTGSRLLTGNSAYAQELEERLAHFHGYEAGLLFSCGYMANLGLLSTIAGEEETFLFDTGVHASMHDGMRLSRALALPFRHNDLEHLEQRLKHRSSRGECLICIESIYSTDGSLAPLREICQLARQYDALVIVDEAHAVGVYGSGGRGLVAEHRLTAEIFAQVVTFGKALGTYGAIVLGSERLKQALINFATSYIYTTAIPHQLLSAIKCSYDLFPSLDKERKQLQTLVQLFRKTAFSSSHSHIQSLLIPGNQAAKEASQKLLHRGFDVRPLLSPTVRRGHEILRICLHAFNTVEELEQLGGFFENRF